MTEFRNRTKFLNALYNELFSEDPLLCATCLVDPYFRAMNLSERQIRAGEGWLKLKQIEKEDEPEVLETFEARLLRLSSGNNGFMADKDIPVQLKEFLASPYTHEMIYEFWAKHEEFESARIQDVGLVAPGNGSVERMNSRGQRMLDNAHNSTPEFLSAKQFMRSVDSRLPKFYREKTDKLAYEAYRSGLRAERDHSLIHNNDMFDMSSIIEPTHVDLNEGFEYVPD